MCRYNARRPSQAAVSKEVLRLPRARARIARAPPPPRGAKRGAMPLGRRNDYGEARFAGVEVDDSADVERDLQARAVRAAAAAARQLTRAQPRSPCQAALAGGFDFLVAPLALPRDASVPASVLRPPLPRSEFLLCSTSWSNQLVGRASAWLAPDAPDAQLRADSEAALRAELSWAAHLSLQARAAAAAAAATSTQARRPADTTRTAPPRAARLSSCRCTAGSAPTTRA